MLIVVPDMGTQPGGSHDPVVRGNADILRRAVCPDIRIMMGCHPSASIHPPGSLPPPPSHPSQQIKQRTVTLRKVTDLCRPVIHFHIDIDRKFGVPARLHFFIPDPLQICRQAAGAAARNQKISSIIKISSGIFQTFHILSCQAEPDTSKETAVIRLMISQDLFISFLCRRIQTLHGTPYVLKLFFL